MNPTEHRPARLATARAGAADVSASVPDDARLVRALDEYRSALESGRRPDPDEFLARHADIAADLAPGLAALEFVCAASPDLSRPDGDGPDQYLQPEGPLGDFRLVREVGRGGMGVVYEAVQISLGRRVAVKVLPFAAALDPRQLQRFQAEAQAAAHLHHQNIVPVYAVGCERGVHYYAMQLVEGHSLAALIAELRREPPSSSGGAPCRPGASGPSGAIGSRRPQPGSGGQADTAPVAARTTHLSRPDKAHFRRIAELVAQAADALEHAHAQGVIHRDIKPANLLLDGRGRLWVTDFGLAQMQNQATLTLTGDLVGTLRYMSPEQALARHEILDHRTDVYSLGATLYELLTLEPAFGGDRQELLRQIASEEPRPPRKLDPAIPAELDTIVLKAMAKEPGERYATARALADDLRRFLDDRPILARRPTAWQRLRKLARRHRPAVVTAAAAAVVLLVLAVVGLAVSNFYITRETQQKEAALAEARRSRDVALENLRLALRAVDEIYTRVADNLHQRITADPANKPLLQPFQRELLERALQFYQEFAKRTGDEPTIRLDVAVAFHRVGQIQLWMGQRGPAEQAIRQAADSLEGLVQEFPAEPDYRAKLGDAYVGLGDSHHGREGPEAERHFAEAGEWYGRAVAVLEPLVAEVPDAPAYRLSLSAAHTHLGYRLSTQPPRSVRAFEKAVAVLEGLVARWPDQAPYRDELLRGYGYRADALANAGRPREAEQSYRRALGLHDAIKGPADLSSRRPIRAVLLAGLSRALAAQGHLDEALAAGRQAMALYEALVSDFPNVHQYQDCLAPLCAQLAQWLDPSDPEGALRLHRLAWAHYEKLVAITPGEAHYLAEQVSVLHNLNNCLLNTGRHPEAVEAYHKVLARLERQLASSPAGVGKWDVLAKLHFALLRLPAEGDVAPAREAALRRIRDLVRRSEEELPTQPDDRRAIFAYYLRHGRDLLDVGRLREADPVIRRGLELRDDYYPAWHYHARTILGLGDTAGYRQLCARLLERFGGTDHPDEANGLAWLCIMTPDAVTDRAKVVALAETAVRLGAERYPDKLADYLDTLGAALDRAGRVDEAIERLNESLKVRTNDLTAQTWVLLALVHAGRGDREEARRWYDRSGAWMEQRRSWFASHWRTEDELRRLRAEAAELIGP